MKAIKIRPILCLFNRLGGERAKVVGEVVDVKAAGGVGTGGIAAGEVAITPALLLLVLSRTKGGGLTGP